MLLAPSELVASETVASPIVASIWASVCASLATLAPSPVNSAASSAPSGSPLASRLMLADVTAVAVVPSGVSHTSESTLEEASGVVPIGGSM